MKLRQFHNNGFHNSDELYKFFGIHKMPKLPQKGLEILNSTNQLTIPVIKKHAT